MDSDTTMLPDQQSLAPEDAGMGDGSPPSEILPESAIEDVEMGGVE